MNKDGPSPQAPPFDPNHLPPGGRAGWLELRVDTPHGCEELVAETLRQTPLSPVWTDGPAEPSPPLGQSAVRTFLPAGPAQTEELDRVKIRLSALAERSGLPELEGLHLRCRPIPVSDWANAWRGTWRPFRIGRLCVVPPWRKTPLRSNDISLRLEPGGVFGTGRHATTRTCLRELQSLPVQSACLLDAGTGTGILSVAALLLGAKHVFAFDTDPGSASHAGELARDNAIAEAQAQFQTGGFELLEQVNKPVDGVMANIYHDVLQSQASRLAPTLRPGGWFLFSGIHRDQRAATVDAVRCAGLHVQRNLRVGKWCTLVGIRPESLT